MTNLNFKGFVHLDKVVFNVVGVSTAIDDNAEVFGSHGRLGSWGGAGGWVAVGLGLGLGVRFVIGAGMGGLGREQEKRDAL